jgi:hypothetical protein
VTLRVDADMSDPTFAFKLRRATDQLEVFRSDTPGVDMGMRTLRAGQVFTVEFSLRTHLVAGSYLLDCAVFHAPSRRIESQLMPAAFITVEDDQTCAGIAHLQPTTRLVQTPSAAPASVGR